MFIVQATGSTWTDTLPLIPVQQYQHWYWLKHIKVTNIKGLNILALALNFIIQLFPPKLPWPPSLPLLINTNTRQSLLIKLTLFNFPL